MAKWETEDLSVLDLHILIERLRGIYPNVHRADTVVRRQPSRLELEAARRLELLVKLINSQINIDLVLEMAQAAYEAANRETSKEYRDRDLPSWDKAPQIDREGWIAGIAAGVCKFLSSLQEGGDADGIMGKQNREGPSHGTEHSEAAGETKAPAQPRAGL